MSGMSMEASWHEREAEETERYLKRYRHRTCGECGNIESCPCGCEWGTCPHSDEDGGYISKSEHAVRDYECMFFEERMLNDGQ